MWGNIDIELGRRGTMHPAGNLCNLRFDEIYGRCGDRKVWGIPQVVMRRAGSSALASGDNVASGIVMSARVNVTTELVDSDTIFYPIDMPLHVGDGVGGTAEPLQGFPPIKSAHGSNFPNICRPFMRQA